MNKANEKNSGITLIALIITIIVLLILAGITINAISNTENAMEKGKEAKQKMDEALIEEQARINEVNSKLETEWDGSIADSFAGGDGSADTPFLIENGSQLAYFAGLVNGTITPLPEGVTDKTFKNKFVSIKKSINLANREFTPIGYGGNSATDGNGSVYTTGRIFQGTLDGNNNVITGLKISSNDMKQRQGVALVGVLGQYGTVKNIDLFEGEVNGAIMVGGIVGASKGTVDNCRNSTNVTAIKSNSDSGHIAGGIVAYTNSGCNIRNCKNFGKISSEYSDLACGILGWQQGSGTVEITNCSNSGTITANKQLAGGIVGEIEGTGTITNCSNKGKVRTVTESAAGGIVAWKTGKGTITITNCDNSGTITANKQLAGGIVGGIEGTGTITNCRNSGLITATTSYSGGIVGLGSGTANITECNNSGNVSSLGTNAAGGVIGQMNAGSIIDCSNSGTITANRQQAGGICGYLNGGNIKRCSNSGMVEAKSIPGNGIAGGIVGVSKAKICDVYNSGIVKVGNYSGGDDRAGGIVGIQNTDTASITNAYNRGEIIRPQTSETGDVIGGILGNKMIGSVTNAYYYSTDENLPGIGTGASTADEANSTQAIYNSLYEFINWCKSNNKYVNVE